VKMMMTSDKRRQTTTCLFDHSRALLHSHYRYRISARSRLNHGPMHTAPSLNHEGCCNRIFQFPCSLSLQCKLDLTRARIPLHPLLRVQVHSRQLFNTIVALDTSTN
jgi:hypothetical protein